MEMILTIVILVASSVSLIAAWFMLVDLYFARQERIIRQLTDAANARTNQTNVE